MSDKGAGLTAKRKHVTNQKKSYKLRENCRHFLKLKKILKISSQIESMSRFFFFLVENLICHE